MHQYPTGHTYIHTVGMNKLIHLLGLALSPYFAWNVLHGTENHYDFLGWIWHKMLRSRGNIHIIMVLWSREICIFSTGRFPRDGEADIRGRSTNGGTREVTTRRDATRSDT